MGQRIQRFPLTIAGETRLWYQSIHPFQGNWEELRRDLGLSFLRQVIQGNSCFMHGDPFTLMEMQRQLMHMYRG